MIFCTVQLYDQICQSLAKSFTGLLARVITFTGDEVKLSRMTTYGKIKAFNPRTDDWEVYQERLQFYMLTVCGDSTFKLLRSLVPEGKLDADAVTYDSLVKLLNTHYSKKQSTIVHHFNFHTHSRQPSESIADYIVALRELALNCKFGDHLEESLRDRLVCGVNHSGIQRKLLSEGELTYASALKLAQSIEAGREGC